MFIAIFIVIISLPFGILFFLIRPINDIFVMGNNSFSLIKNVDAAVLFTSY